MASTVELVDSTGRQCEAQLGYYQSTTRQLHENKKGSRTTKLSSSAPSVILNEKKVLTSAHLQKRSLRRQEQGQTSKPVEFRAFSRQRWRTHPLGPNKHYPVLNVEPSTQTNVVWTTLIVFVLRNTAHGQLFGSVCHCEKLSKKKC